MDNRIKGFEWNIPLAFKDCIAQCKFDHGDVIYKNKSNAKNWGEEKIDIDFLIQVKSPLRASANSNSSDIDVFRANWNSKIVFEKIYPNNSDLNTKIETTQGHFFTYLWKNDETILNSNQILKPVITSISAKQIDSKFIKSKIPDGWHGFAIIMDCVSNLVISKRTLIDNALSEKYTCRSEVYEFDEAVNLNIEEQKSYSGISPTLSLELFLIQSNNSEEIIEKLKSVLFKGVKNRFNINTHGLLIKK